MQLKTVPASADVLFVSSAPHTGCGTDASVDLPPALNLFEYYNPVRSNFPPFACLGMSDLVLVAAAPFSNVSVSIDKLLSLPRETL